MMLCLSAPPLPVGWSPAPPVEWCGGGRYGVSPGPSPPV